MQRPWVLSLSLLCSSLIASVAEAESRVVVRPFYGPHAEQVRREVEQVLEKHATVVVVDSREADATARKLHVDANAPKGRTVVAQSLQLSAWVEGIVQKQGNKLRATVLVYDGPNHERIGRAVVMEKNPDALTRGLKTELWRNIGKAITEATPAEPAEEPAEAPPEAQPVAQAEEAPVRAPAGDEAPASDSSSAARSGASGTVAGMDEFNAMVRATSSSTAFLPGGSATSSGASPSLETESALTDSTDDSSAEGKTALRVAFSLGSLYRKLAFRDAITQNIGDYNLPAAPLADLRLAYFPGAYVSSGALSWFGLDLRGQYALGIRTIDSNGDEFKSRFGSLHLGARLEAPVGKHSIGAFAGYGIQKFSLIPETKGSSTPTPNVDYRMIRAGASAELAISEKLRLGMEAAYLYLLSAGDIASNDWFPRTQVGGLEIGIDASYSLSQHLFLRAFGTYQRFFFDFNAEPGDPAVAGGAADNYVSVGFGVGLRI